MQPLSLTAYAFSLSCFVRGLRSLRVGSLLVYPRLFGTLGPNFKGAGRIGTLSRSTVGANEHVAVAASAGATRSAPWVWV
jgi:hypothetical protein